MKKLNFILGILLIALVGFITSCEKDEDAIGPSLVLTAGGDNITADATVIPGATLNFAWEARKGDKNLSTFNITREGLSVPDWEEFDIPAAQNAIYIDSDELIAPSNVGVYSYVFTVTDKDGLKASVSINITVAPATTPLSAEVDGTFERVGGANGTGLATFGLQWLLNTASNAIITKDEATKFVLLSASDWADITTVEDLEEAIDAADDFGTDGYRGISVTADKSDYTDVLGVQFGENLYIIKIVSSDVTAGGAGTTITVSIKYKN